MAESHRSVSMAGKSQKRANSNRSANLSQEHLRRQSVTLHHERASSQQHETNIQCGDGRQCDSQYRSSNKQPRNSSHNEQIHVRDVDVTSRQDSVIRTSETELLSLQHAEECEDVERSPSLAGRPRDGQASTTARLVISTFNCENWKSNVMRDFINELSCQHSRSIVVACQETWRYDIPKIFQKELGKKYFFIHESAMDPKSPRRRGRPHGGIALIISKDIAFKIKYTNSRCLSVLLSDYNILLNNVYLPFDDQRISVEQNVQNLSEAIGHLEAAHELATETLNYITLGDFNVDPTDNNRRSEILNDFFTRRCYNRSDITHLPPNDYSHKSGRLLDHIVSTDYVSDQIVNLYIPKDYLNSDHFPVVAHLQTEMQVPVNDSAKKPKILWKKASQKALQSYSRLSQKTCSRDLKKFERGEISGTELYNSLVNNLENAAHTCLPKSKPCTEARRHDIPMWREVMTSFKDDVTYWTLLQFQYGGPRRCPHVIRTQLRLAKSRYRHRFRALKREIEINVAESITVNNCFNRLFRHAKTPTPTLIDGCKTHEQPEMWHEHFKDVFQGESSPFEGSLLSDVNENIYESDILNFDYVSIDEMNTVLLDIDTNKSYKRHYHWKHLQRHDHAAKYCLLSVLNFWIRNVLCDDNNVYFDWNLFFANVNLIPKKDKKDLSTKKAWRPISVGTSENWILEKILLYRIQPFLITKDNQFGYKAKHGTSHAIELLRILERRHDAHICMLDASSAFDKLSWRRIKDQLCKRKLPFIIIKLVLIQLFSTRICVCNTVIFYARVGVKQGGVLSGILFSSCYDDLVVDLENLGAGILFSCGDDKFKFICVIIYADDVVLISASPFGLKRLIKAAFNFASRYSDISFNASKSAILRLGPHRKPPVSVCGIPTENVYTYLGVDIGQAADPQKVAASQLYKNTNVLLSQNPELRKCSTSVKNVCISSYGNVYSVENFLSVDSRVRQAHRYMTKKVHTDWRQYADLDGPNIRSRRLYCVYDLDSLEVIHRFRRNNFLLKASVHNNAIIRDVIGNLDRITV